LLDLGADTILDPMLIRRALAIPEIVSLSKVVPRRQQPDGCSDINLSASQYNKSGINLVFVICVTAGAELLV